ncbi:YdiU family protein [Akkermansiaceae bacterium]|nr:YdiU family protein [Akkermansiaceae bacterium]
MISFSNTYVNLPEHFYERSDPAQVPSPALIAVNDSLAKELGIDPEWLKSDEGLAVLSGNIIAEGSQPLAQAYAGHQFGGFSPQLGDGRAILLGEVINEKGQRKDIQLKGSGRTPFSRNGDGKSALGPVVREYLMSEAMYALGVPTTRALAAVTTGEKVIREQATDGGIFTRVASSHLRIGTFQYFAARRDIEALQTLTEFALERHYSEAKVSSIPALTLLENVINAQATLVAHWMSIGFIHGVMNTDNCSISGETIDYGPCAFMDDFHPGCVFSAIDREARYAWGKQVNMAHWNLTRLAEALLPIINPDEEKAIKLVEVALDQFSEQFTEHYHAHYKAKFSLTEETSTEFVQESLSILANQQVDYTLFFRKLTQLANEEIPAIELEALFPDKEVYKNWQQTWLSHLDKKKISAMREVNPILIPRNHQVEVAIQGAYKGDFSLFHHLNEAWKNPFTENPQYSDLEAAPLPNERVTQTFCGT